MLKLFIDGREGTTGLRITDRLEGRSDISLLTLPEELRNVAVSLKEQGDTDLRSPLAEAVALGILEGYSDVKAGKLTYLSDYRRLSTVLGKEVRFCRNGE